MDYGPVLLVKTIIGRDGFCRLLLIGSDPEVHAALFFRMGAVNANMTIRINIAIMTIEYAARLTVSALQMTDVTIALLECDRRIIVDLQVQNRPANRYSIRTVCPDVKEISIRVILKFGFQLQKNVHDSGDILIGNSPQ